MNTLQKLQHSFCTFLSHYFSIDTKIAQEFALTLNTDEQKQQFGDVTSSAALGLAKIVGKNPRAIAQEIVTHFKDPAIQTIDIAGPGFLNMTLHNSVFDKLSQEVFTLQNGFFKENLNTPKSINIEFVSANPTGPLHFGHGRGGIIGDVLGNVLHFLGHAVTKEFYINDAGAQITKLGTSFKIRYQQASGMDVSLPEDAYHGHYLLDLAHELFTEHGDRLLDQPDDFFSTFAKEQMLHAIKATLTDYGITFDIYFSEKTLHENAIDKAIDILNCNGMIYEFEGAIWLRSTNFGDDKDRVLKKKTGELTYAAADVAYMKNKADRNYAELIYILGHDHHSYAQRLESIRQALALTNTKLDVILYQLVKIKDGDEQVRMSKRKGNIVTLQDVIDTVGKDIARFFYLQRKADAQLEFDLELALKHTDENPVYYIQYAYVRTGSIIKNAEQEPALQNILPRDLHNLSTPDKLLIKKIISLKETLITIQNTHQTHLLAYFTHELAQAFNRYYNQNRVINVEDIQTSRSRLALMHTMRNTLSLCLDLLGLSKPSHM